MAHPVVLEEDAVGLSMDEDGLGHYQAQAHVGAVVESQSRRSAQVLRHCDFSEFFRLSAELITTTHGARYPSFVRPGMSRAITSLLYCSTKVRTLQSADYLWVAYADKDRKPRARACASLSLFGFAVAPRVADDGTGNAAESRRSATSVDTVCGAPS